MSDIETKGDDGPLEGIKVSMKIDFEVPPEARSMYANHMIVQRTQDETMVTFFELFPPMILGTPAQQQEAYSKVETIKARFVVRVSMPLTKLRKFAKAIAQVAEGLPAEEED